MNGVEDERSELCGEGFCRGDADFRVGARVESRVGGAWNGGVHDIADGEDFGAGLPCEFDASISISGFAALANGDEGVFRGKNGVGVSIFACDVNACGDASKSFEEIFGDESGVKTRAASDDLDGGGVFEMEVVDGGVEIDAGFVLEDSSAERVGNFLWLFVDFFEHVMGIALFFGGGNVPLDRLFFSRHGVSMRIEDLDEIG